MDDGLAERLFNAFWKPIVDAGYPPPVTWAALGDAQRMAWQAAAVAARTEFADRVDAEVEMLRGANAAWQREYADATAKLEQHTESVRAQVRASMANFADLLEEALKAPHSIGVAMLQELVANMRRISEVS